MPNQPQATPARSRAATLAPKTPKDARAKTGYGIPYLVPAWLFASIGIRTMMFATAIVRMDWYKARPQGAPTLRRVDPQPPAQGGRDARADRHRYPGWATLGRSIERLAGGPAADLRARRVFPRHRAR